MRPSIAWQLARLALAGSRRQAFLDHRAIAWWLRVAPERRRRSLALRILSLSPHYFIYQWERYPAHWPRRRVLEAEHERNVRSRRQIATRLLAPRIDADATVLDFGCGPGFLAGQVCPLAREVIAVDVSGGTLACARVLHPGPAYRLNRGGELPVADATIDLVYSIAVLQHIDPADWPAYFDEFVRVLRPGGHGVCHVVVDDLAPASYRPPKGPRARYSLRFEPRAGDQIAATLVEAGFTDVRVEPLDPASGIDDDVGRQHTATFRKPA